MTQVFKGQGLTVAVRWMKFNFVGVMGALLQLFILAVCTYAARLSYLPAVTIAIECTIVHNFLWHERFTWGDRRCWGWKNRARRLLCFNATNGAISLAGNLLLMRLFIEQFHLPILVANGIAIIACSIVNFTVGDRFVFTRRLCT
jgi:putative flippase GtrA